ncbi:MAG: type II toxin-antitoxin system RelB/DinJ family antitoxin [Patescibacteria group bacterium]|mgnify:CR=1 FL=1
MNTTLTIKTPKKLRDDAKKTAQAMGVPLTTVMNSMLKQFVRDRRLVLEAECPFPSHTPNAETRKAIQELQAYKAGKRGTVRSYATANEMFADILGRK